MSETFDLIAFVEGSSYPTKTVTVYTNVAAMNAVADIRAEIAEADNTIDIPAQQERESRLDAAKADVEASAINFELQGMPYAEAQEIANIFTDTGATESELFDLIIATLKKVTDANGAVASLPSKEQLEKLHKKLAPLEFNKLLEGAIEVNFSAAKYESEVDAGFPGGAADTQ